MKNNALTCTVQRFFIIVYIETVTYCIIVNKTSGHFDYLVEHFYKILLFFLIKKKVLHRLKKKSQLWSSLLDNWGLGTLGRGERMWGQAA